MPEIHYHNGSAVAKMRELHYHNGSAVVAIREAWYHNGSAVVKVFSPGTVLAPAGSIEHTVIVPADAAAHIVVRQDGTTTFGVGNSSSVPGNWFTPTTASIGNGYRLYVEQVSGSAPNGSGNAPMNTWMDLTIARSFSQIVTGTGARQAVWRFYIGDPSLNVISTGLVTITANAEI